MVTQKFGVLIKVADPLLGFRFILSDKNKLIINDIMLQTPANRIPHWRTEFKNSVLLSVNKKKITTIEDVSKIVADSRASGNKFIKFKFALFEKSKKPSKNKQLQMDFN